MTSPAPEVDAKGFDLTYAQEQIRRREHQLRRFVKGFYLRNLLADVQGATVDLGCGAGQLLERLPPDSIGLEVNPHLVSFLQAKSLPVMQVAASPETFDLPGLPAGRFTSLIVAHVLEHLDDPAKALDRLLAACRRVGITRVVIVVPGAAGFASDRTHRTFVDATYVQQHFNPQRQGFRQTAMRYFPGPWAWIGRVFVFHELKIVLDADRASFTGDHRGSKDEVTHDEIRHSDIESRRDSAGEEGL